MQEVERLVSADSQLRESSGQKTFVRRSVFLESSVPRKEEKTIGGDSYGGRL